MDKSWMNLDSRIHPTYHRGVKDFVNFAVDHMGTVNTICCPCYKCNNFLWLKSEEVGDHLMIHGIVRSYVSWIYHGERSNTNNGSEPIFEDLDDNIEEDIDRVGDGNWEMLEELNNGNDFEDWAYASNSNCSKSHEVHGSNTFANLFRDATQPLYAGCKASRLSFIVKLLHVKIINGWMDKSFTMLLEVLQHILPADAYVLPNYYHAKQVIRDLGLKYEKIDACKNDCIFFRKELVDVNACLVCNSLRYKTVQQGLKQVTEKALCYFPLTPRLQRLFISSKTASEIWWHIDMRVKDGILRHLADSKHWKDFNQQYLYFASEPRNVRLGLASDGFNPFNNMSCSYSMWSVFLVPYNLPPRICMKENFLLLTLLILGSKAPGNEIDVYLQQLIDELSDLWNEGVELFDASTNNAFQIRQRPPLY